MVGRFVHRSRSFFEPPIDWTTGSRTAATTTTTTTTTTTATTTATTTRGKSV